MTDRAEHSTALADTLCRTIDKSKHNTGDRATILHAILLVLCNFAGSIECEGCRDLHTKRIPELAKEMLEARFGSGPPSDHHVH
jgi:hypothetical protein